MNKHALKLLKETESDKHLAIAEEGKENGIYKKYDLDKFSISNKGAKRLVDEVEHENVMK